MTNPLVLCSSAAGFFINPESHRRPRALNFNHGLNSVISAHKIAIQLAASQSLLHLSMSRGMQRNIAVYSSVPGAPLPSTPPSGSWNGWVLGIVVSVILPILTKKCGALLLNFKNIEAAVDTAERIVDVVEQVAEQVEKVAEDILDDLPAGNLKDVVSVIENVAERTGDGAEVLGDLIDKVQEVEEKVESIVESGINDEESKNQKQEVSISDEADSKETGAGQPQPIG